jgi:hypothetical protein
MKKPLALFTLASSAACFLKPDTAGTLNCIPASVQQHLDDSSSSTSSLTISTCQLQEASPTNKMLLKMLSVEHFLSKKRIHKNIQCNCGMFKKTDTLISLIAQFGVGCRHSTQSK